MPWINLGSSLVWRLDDRLNMSCATLIKELVESGLVKVVNGTGLDSEYALTKKGKKWLKSRREG